MKQKIYYVIGEQSGDQLAFWHSNKHWPDAELFGTGGPLMQQKMSIDIQINELACIGGIQLLNRIPTLYAQQKKILSRIAEVEPDHVILVNFSSFNLSLARKIKAQNSEQKITFFSPPQLWIWGAQRVKKIKKYIDSVEVIFPFEVAWYKKHGVRAVYHGSPLFDRYKDFKKKEVFQPSILCLPGSRHQELAKTLPLFIPVLKKIETEYPQMKINIAVAQDGFVPLIEEACQKENLKKYSFVKHDDLYETFKITTIALTKPGTNTLELAFAGIPAVVVYKMAWPLYFLARLLIRIPFSALPNLILKQELLPEIIQWNCNPNHIFEVVKKQIDNPEETRMNAAQQTLKTIFKS